MKRLAALACLFMLGCGSQQTKAIREFTAEARAAYKAIDQLPTEELLEKKTAALQDLFTKLPEPKPGDTKYQKAVEDAKTVTGGVAFAARMSKMRLEAAALGGEKAAEESRTLMNEGLKDCREALARLEAY